MNNIYHTTNWRNDITGLRALAVLPVVIYHFFPTIIPNGFLGVDVFFVISGYLISGIIFRELNANTFSWKDFYAKRIKRIIPPLLAVLTFTAIVGWFFLTDKEYEDVGKEIFGSAFFFENIRLLSRINYFDPSVIYKPLVHIWSLSVEEQFYILFPLIVILLWKFSQNKKLLGVLIALITLFSLIACFTISDKHFVFYFPLTRFWELSFGIILAYIETFYQFNLKGKKANYLSILSLITILTVYWVTIPGLTSPSILNLICVIAVTLLIACGNSALINRSLLSFKPMIWIGLISYSLYLWHWPLVSYLTIIYPMGGGKIKLSIMLIAFILAILSYRYIENPIRKLTGNKSRKVVIRLLIGLLIAFTVGQLIRNLHGIPSREFNQQTPQFIARTKLELHETKLTSVSLNGVNVETTTPNSLPEILFIGDSHMEQYIERINLLGNKYHQPWAIYSLGGCLIIPGIRIGEDCYHETNTLNQLLTIPSIKTVVIGQIWGEYQNTLRSNHSFKKQNGKFLHLKDGGFTLAIQKLRQIIKSHPNIKFYILLDAPWDHGSYNPANHYSRLKSRDKQSLPIVPYPKLNWWKTGNNQVQKELSDVATIIEVASKVCPNQKCDLTNYRDDDHLNPVYLKANATWLDPIFQDLDKSSK